MKTYLVLLDFSPGSEETFQTAITFCELGNARLALLNVIQESIFFDGMGAGLAEDKETVEAMFSEARSALNEYASRAVDLGLECNVYVLRGSPAVCIAHQAAQVGADLIFMGSHGHGRLHHALIGSTLEEVLTSAPCPIVVTPRAKVPQSEFRPSS